MTSDQKRGLFLSIVIPALNEERHLQISLPKLIDFLKSREWGYEILVVDDGSRDGTSQIVDTYAKSNPTLRLVRQPRTYGKGWAIRTGMLAAAGKFVIFMDADLAYDLEDAAQVVRKLQEGYDVVIGSRALEGSQILQHPPWKRRLASWLFNRLVQGLFSLGTPDTQCGLKGFSQAAARRLFTMQTVHSFAFDVEILYWAHRWNFKISQVPVTLVSNDSSSVRFTRHTFGVLLDLWKIRWRTGPFGSRASRPDPRREEAS